MSQVGASGEPKPPERSDGDTIQPPTRLKYLPEAHALFAIVLWVRGAKNKDELVIVDNSNAPNIPMTGKLKQLLPPPR